MKWLKEIDFSLTSFTESFNKEYEGKSLGNCEGYLYIQSRSLWRFPNHLWKRRYFTLRNDSLYFTKDQGDLIFEDTTPRIDIEADTGIYPEESKGNSRKKYFIRITQGNKNYILCSGEENDRNTWLASLLTVITQKFVINFKCGSYKSIRLNYKPNKISQRHSSFVPKRASSDSEYCNRHTNNNNSNTNAPGILYKAESLFNLSAYKDIMYEDRSSFIALV